MLGEKYHRIIFYTGIVLLLLGLPLSPFLMSIAQFILGGNWLLEKNYKEKFKQLKSNKIVLLLMGLFLLHLIGLIYTSDFSYAIRDIQRKLPLLTLAFVLGTYPPLKLKIRNRFLSFYLFAVFCGTFMSMVKYFGFIGADFTDIREISLYISHIRFGLMICFAVFVALYLFFIEKKSLVLKSIYLIAAFWFLVFLFILSAISGIVFLGIAGFLFFLIYGNQYISKKSYTVTITVVILLFSLFSYISFQNYTHQFKLRTLAKTAKGNLKTTKGNSYLHKESCVIENGNYTYHYICMKELESAWKKVSLIPLHSNNINGYEMKATLLRFLTSKGFKKDEEGVFKLTKEEIKAIENGIPNVDLMNKTQLYTRFHQTIWELGSYLNGVASNGHSLAQRFVYWELGLDIIKENWLFGVGTGDVQLAFDEQYKKNKGLEFFDEYHHRAHNQYLTFWISFGIVGFVYFLHLCFCTVLNAKNNRLLFVFSLIMLLSYFTEDTLETQAGVTFLVGMTALLKKETTANKESN